MKRFYLLFSMLFFFLAAFPANAFAPDSLIRDPNLEKAIRSVLKKPTGEILISELETIKDLRAPNSNITDLEGLQYLTNLTRLDLYNNNIKDISPLAFLTKLSWLDINNNVIVDVSPLSQLESMHKLNLSSNRIADVSPLLNGTCLSAGDAVSLEGNSDLYKTVIKKPAPVRSDVKPKARHKKRNKKAPPLVESKFYTQLHSPIPTQPQVQFIHLLVAKNIKVYFKFPPPYSIGGSGSHEKKYSKKDYSRRSSSSSSGGSSSVKGAVRGAIGAK
jgi:Leucine-rich repeat (LRR) protein